MAYQSPEKLNVLQYTVACSGLFHSYFFAYKFNTRLIASLEVIIRNIEKICHE